MSSSGSATMTTRRLAERRFDLHSNWSGVPPPREWVCKGWLSHRLTLFTGHGGSGKSRLALQLAAAVASGTPDSWIPSASDELPMPMPPITDANRAAPVVIASWEDEKDEVHRRLVEMAKRLPWAAPDHINGRLNFADMAGCGPLWEATAAAGKLTAPGTDLRSAAEQLSARLLIIDPRAAAYAGDENSRAHVRAFISHWDRWAREHQCAVLLVDHVAKSATPEQHGTSSYAGSTDWRNAARSVWTLGSKDNKGTADTWLRCDKSNYGPVPATVHLDSGDGYAWIASAGPSGDDITYQDLPV